MSDMASQDLVLAAMLTYTVQKVCLTITHKNNNNKQQFHVSAKILIHPDHDSQGIQL